MVAQQANKRGRGLAVVVAGIATIGLVAWWLRPGEVLLQGQVEATEVNVGAKVPGRLAEVLVQQGDTVQAGQVLARLAAPEIQARATQADAVIAAAQANSDKAREGAQSQDIEAAQMQWQAAERAAELAEITFGRVQRLNAQGVVPRQKRDEAFAQSKATRAQANAANALYRKALEGARPEDRRAADAQLAQAQGGRAEVQAALDERDIRAPVGGEVSTRVLEPGEIAAAGAPVVVIVDLSDAWIVLNLREDGLAGARMGREFEATIPALSNRKIRLRIVAIAPVGNFATWRSARDLGGFDLRTFEIRARPVEAVEGLRPGMTAVVAQSALADEA